MLIMTHAPQVQGDMWYEIRRRQEISTFYSLMSDTGILNWDRQLKSTVIYGDQCSSMYQPIHFSTVAFPNPDTLWN